MFPAKFAPVLFGFFLSGLMSCLVAGISTVRVVGLVDGVILQWMSAWMVGWVVAFPTVLVVAPIARRLVARLVRD